LDKFWLARRKGYPELFTEALKILIPFVTPYIYEIAFSTIVAIKTKQRNSPSLEDDLFFYASLLQNHVLKNLKRKTE
jgi:hypothetical protein